MQPRIIFLGTGGDVFTMSRQFFATGGLLFLYNKKVFHLDPGPGALVQLAKQHINPRHITAVLASRHAVLRDGDVPALISAMTYDGFDKRGVLIQSLEGIHDFDNAVERALYLSPYEGITEIGIEDIEIKALPCFHQEGIGFKITTNDFTLVYSGDTGWSDQLIDFYAGAHFLILHMPSIIPQNNQLGKEEIISIIDQVRPKLAIISGFGIKMLSMDILNEIRDIQKATGIQTIAARDHLVLNLNEYYFKQQ